MSRPVEARAEIASKGVARRSSTRLHPLSPAVFLTRNLGKTIPLTLVIMLSVMLVSGVIALVNSIPYSIRTIYGYTKVTLGISPRGDSSHLPALLGVIRKESPVPIERIVRCRASGSEVTSIVGKWPFIVLGLSQDDMRYFLMRQAVVSIDGRLPKAGEPEAVISQPVATNLRLHLGSVLQGPENSDSYSQRHVIVVGIAKTDRWLMVNSIEYQRAYHFPPIDFAMVFAHDRRDQEQLDTWAEKRFKGERAQIFTYSKIDSDTNKMFETLFAIIDVVIGMLVLMISMMMAMLVNIYQAQRMVEFGLLQAIGYTRKQLVVRSIVENVVIVVIGWVIGVIAALGLLVTLRTTLMEPRAYVLNVLDPIPFRYTIPIPITILLVACLTVVIRFRRFDPVAVVERRLV
jgi:hypothetical protein